MRWAEVTLPASLSRRHLELVLQYFEDTGGIRTREWPAVLHAFDALANGTVARARRRLAFRQVYDRYVDKELADSFLSKLMALEDLDAAGETLQRETSMEVLRILEREGIYRDDLPQSEYLAAYCLYWWAAFAKGYRFEVEVLRDLRASGVTFIAHDIRKHSERRSPYDLVVSGQAGDIKSTTYFLHTARSLPLTCDFYITRLYLPRERRRLFVVILTEEAWHVLDGDVTAASLEAAASFFPAPVQVELDGRPWIVVPLDVWKDKVKKHQTKENE